MHSHSLVFRAGWLPVQGGPDQSGRVWSDANRHFARESRVPLGQSRTWQYKIRTSHLSPYVQRLSMGELLGRRGGPGLLLGMTSEAIEELSARGVRECGNLGVTLDLLGAERRLRVPMMDGTQFWLERHFQRVGCSG